MERAKGLVGKVTKEQPDRKFAERMATFERIVEVVERQRSETWTSFKDRHGDWGRDLVLYMARRRSGLSLKEIGDKADGLDYKVVGKAVQRFAKKLERDRSLKTATTECLNQLSYDET